MKSARHAALCLLLGLGFGPIARADDILVLYALDADQKALVRQAPPPGLVGHVAGRIVQRYTIGKHRIYPVKMGSGAVETAITAAAVLARVRCDVILSLGPAGGLTNQLAVGTWTEVTELACYQQGAQSPDGFSRKVDFHRTGTLPAGLSLPETLRQARKVRAASGEVFVASSEFRLQLAGETKAQLVEMNLFGINEAAARFGIPHYAWRIVSDLADEQASAAFKTFANSYKGEGGEFLATLIQEWPSSKSSPRDHPALESLLQQPSPR